MRSSVSSPPPSPGPERPAAAVSTAGKSATRIRTSDELGAGPLIPPADGPLRAVAALQSISLRSVLAAVQRGRLSSNSLPPCRSGAARQPVSRSPAALFAAA